MNTPDNSKSAKSRNMLLIVQIYDIFIMFEKI